MNNDLSDADRLNNAMEMAKFAWWEMNLPHGEVYFAPTKAKMLGRDPADFKHYKDFTNLVHPADYEPMMQDMRDHLEGRKSVYETIYRIKHANGEYVQFYDRGKVVERNGKKIRLAGIVLNMEVLTDYLTSLTGYEPINQDDFNNG